MISGFSDFFMRPKSRSSSGGGQSRPKPGVRSRRNSGGGSRPNPGSGQNPNSKANSPHDSKSARRPKPRRSLSKNIQSIFLVLLFAVAGVLIFMNVRPYIEVAEMLIVPSLAKIGFLNLLTEIPIIGMLFNWLFETLGRFTASIIGTIVWGLVQTAQIAPLVWRADLDVLGSSIRGVQGHKNFELKAEENPAVTKLKRLHNEAPQRFVRFWDRASLISYLVELVICGYRFPPYKGGWSAIMSDMGVWTSDKFDWQNAILLVITMFGCEMVVRIGLWFYQRRFYFAKESGRQAQH